jgi:hypothetical protein
MSKFPKASIPSLIIFAIGGLIIIGFPIFIFFGQNFGDVRNFPAPFNDLYFYYQLLISVFFPFTYAIFFFLGVNTLIVNLVGSLYYAFLAFADALTPGMSNQWEDLSLTNLTLSSMQFFIPVTLLQWYLFSCLVVYLYQKANKIASQKIKSFFSFTLLTGFLFSVGLTGFSFYQTALSKTQGSYLLKEMVQKERIRMCGSSKTLPEQIQQCQKYVQEKYPRQPCDFSVVSSSSDSCRSCIIQCRKK